MTNSEFFSSLSNNFARFLWHKFLLLYTLPGKPWDLFQQKLMVWSVCNDQTNNLNLCNKIESYQYNAALAITGAIRGSSKEKLYQELGFEYLSSRRWLRKLCTFYRIVRNKSPGYLYKYILPGDRAYLTRNSNNIKQIFCRSEYFANSFFPYMIKEWNMLSLEIRNSESYSKYN